MGATCCGGRDEKEKMIIAKKDLLEEHDSKLNKSSPPAI